MRVLVCGLGVTLLALHAPALPVPSILDTLRAVPSAEVMDGWLRSGQYERVTAAAALAGKAKTNSPAEWHIIVALAHAALERFDAAQEQLERARFLRGAPDPLAAPAVAGFKALRESRGAEARALALEAARADVSHPLPHCLLALIDHAQRDFESAASHAIKAIALAPQNAHAHTILGTLRFERQDYAQALRSFETAVGVNPHDLRPLLGLGATLATLNRRAEAVAVYQRAESLNAQSARASEQLARLHIDAGQVDLAIQAATTAATRDSQSAIAQEILATAHGVRHDAAAALPHARRFAALRPAGDPGAARLLALCLASSGRLEEAARALQSSLQSHPRDFQLQFTHAVLRQHLDPPAQARARFLELLTNSPAAERQSLEFCLANAALDAGDAEAAAKHLARLDLVTRELGLAPADLNALPLRSGSSGGNWVNLASLFIRHQWLAAAQQALQQAVDTNPNNFLAVFLRGRVASERSEWTVALASFEQLRRLLPRSTGPSFAIAELHRVRGELDAALTGYRSVLALDPNHAASHLRTGAVLESRGEYADAEQAYRRVVEILPESPAGYNQLAYFYAERQIKLGEAEALARQSLRLASNNPAFLDTLGWVLIRGNKPTEAVAPLQSAIRLLPNSPVFHYHLALAFLGLRDRPAAARHLETALSLATNFPGAIEAAQTLREIKKIQPE